jgi:hypothetical protein
MNARDSLLRDGVASLPDARAPLLSVVQRGYGGSQMIKQLRSFAQ